MFGLNEALMSFIRRQVGLRTDAADPAGSLHAKVTDVKNAVAALPVYNWGNTIPKSWSASHSNIGTETTVISVSGSGFLTSYSAVESSSSGISSAPTTIKVYIDDTLVDSFSFTATIKPNTASIERNSLIWRFKKSFSISVVADTSSVIGSVYAQGFLG